MGKLTVDEAVDYLKKAGLRADRGYPGTRMPHLTGPVAAVNVKKSEPGKITMMASACVPRIKGSEVCENFANAISIIWTSHGASCTYGECRYNSDSILYTIEILGTWEDTVGETTESTA